jgi:hypothetical protein
VYTKTHRIRVHFATILICCRRLGSKRCRAESSSKFKVILRPTVSRSVCLGIKHPSGAYDQIFVTVRHLRVCSCGALSLTRGRVCRLQLLLALASAVIIGSESLGTRNHILLSQIREFFFVASYDSQGHGRGIRPRLHTGWAESDLRTVFYSPYCDIGLKKDLSSSYEGRGISSRPDTVPYL